MTVHILLLICPILDFLIIACVRPILHIVFAFAPIFVLSHRIGNAVLLFIYHRSLRYFTRYLPERRFSRSCQYLLDLYAPGPGICCTIGSLGNGRKSQIHRGFFTHPLFDYSPVLGDMTAMRKYLSIS